MIDGSFLLLMPAEALIMLIRDEARVVMKLMREEKIKWGSKVTPIKYAVSSLQK